MNQSEYIFINYFLPFLGLIITALAQFYVTSSYNKYKRKKITTNKTGFDVARDLAQNEASGDMTNLGIGLGMMGGVAKTMGDIMGDTLGAATNDPVQTDNGMDAFKLKLEKLKLMKESGLLSDEEFANAKMALLKDL